MKVGVILAVILVLISGTVSAGKLQEGVHYTEVPMSGKARPGGRDIEVAEIFYYGCPHCFKLEKSASQWKKHLPPNTRFVLMPAVTPAWEKMARAYYAMQKLDVLDQLHGKLFDDIHNKKKKFRSDKAIIAYISKEAKIPLDRVGDVFRSSYVDARIRRAKSLQEGWGLASVPAIIVDGKYLVLNPSGRNPKWLDNVIGRLIKKREDEISRNGQ